MFGCFKVVRVVQFLARRAKDSCYFFRYMKNLIGLGLFAGSILVPFGSHYEGRWMVGFILLIVTMAVIVCKRVGILPGLCVFSTLFSAFTVFGNKVRYAEYGTNTALVMDNLALQSFCLFLGFVAVFLTTSKKSLAYLEELFGSLCFVNSLMTLYSIFAGNHNHGFFGNPSMNALMIVMLYPFLVVIPKKIEYVHATTSEIFKNHKLAVLRDLLHTLVPLAAVLMAKEIVPVVAMVACWLLMMVKDWEFSAKQKTRAITGLIIIVGLYFVYNHSLLSNSGRFNVWGLCLRWWHDNGFVLRGTGQGTAFMFLPMIQDQAGEPSNWWIVLHNDFLQVLFEQGIFGLILYSLLYVSCLYRSRDRNYLFIAVVIYGIGSFFNFPSHVAVHAFVGMFLVARAYERPEKTSAIGDNTGPEKPWGFSFPFKQTQTMRRDLRLVDQK